MLPSVIVVRLLLEIFGHGVAADSAELIICPEEPPPGMVQPLVADRPADREVAERR